MVRVNGEPSEPGGARPRLRRPQLLLVQEDVPGGFTPPFGGDVLDYSAVAGVRGQMSDRLSWDVSAGYGSNEVGFFILNTVNASLGSDSTHRVRPRPVRQEEVNVDVRVGYPMSNRVHLAGGLEWRDEKFTIGVGQHGVLGQRSLRRAGLQRGIQRLPRLRPDLRGQLEPQQLRGLRRRRGDRGSNWTVGARRSLRALRRLRLHAQRQARRPLLNSTTTSPCGAA